MLAERTFCQAGGVDAETSFGENEMIVRRHREDAATTL
jgi:hypothetical protein